VSVFGWTMIDVCALLGERSTCITKPATCRVTARLAIKHDSSHLSACGRVLSAALRRKHDSILVSEETGATQGSTAHREWTVNR